MSVSVRTLERGHRVKNEICTNRPVIGRMLQDEYVPIEAPDSQKDTVNRDVGGTDMVYRLKTQRYGWIELGPVMRAEGEKALGREGEGEGWMIR